MAASIIGRLVWGGQRDPDQHRTWTISHKIRTSSKNDGPQVVMNCPGLPAIGSTYAFGNDFDSWAYCYPTMRVTMFQQHDDFTLTYVVEQTFSTRPLYRCNTTSITNPLLEPIKIGGSFVKYTEEAQVDMFGNPFLSSSFERFYGKAVEFDANRPTVWIEQNFSSNFLSTFAPLIDCVNDDVLWGLPARCVKLSNATWERKLYGVCTYYYTVRLDFDINYNTFDRFIRDEGTKVLNGHWGSATGTGCLIDIIVSGVPNGNSKNPITAYAINTGGSGYPNGGGAGQVITLALTGGTGFGASVYVQTNGSGVVTSIATGVINGVDYGNGIANGGQGYSLGTTTGVSTTGSTWVLDKVGGASGHMPNANNPQDFIRYKDLNGECSRVILDGAGQPAVGTRPGYFFAQKYVSANLLTLGIPTIL